MYPGRLKKPSPHPRHQRGPQGPQAVFRPDLQCYRDARKIGVAGLTLLGASVLVSTGIPSAGPLWAIAGAGLAIGAGSIAAKWIREGLRRGRGFAVENAAIAGLRDECRSRGWTLKTDVWFDGLGNLDAVIYTPTMACIIEIKSYGGLRVGFGEGRQTVVRCNRDSTPATTELLQAQRQSAKVKAAMRISMPVVPVLWCPKAPKEAGVVHDGVLLANGPSSFMVEIIAEMDSRMSVAVAVA